MRNMNHNSVQIVWCCAAVLAVLLLMVMALGLTFGFYNSDDITIGLGCTVVVCAALSIRILKGRVGSGVSLLRVRHFEFLAMLVAVLIALIGWGCGQTPKKTGAILMPLLATTYFVWTAKDLQTLHQEEKRMRQGEK